MPAQTISRFAEEFRSELRGISQGVSLETSRRSPRWAEPGIRTRKLRQGGARALLPHRLLAEYDRRMAVLHISAAEAARNFTALMARVRAGEKIVIEDDSSPVAVLQPIVAEHVRLLSESLRLAKKHASRATLDGDFERDLEAVINSHPEPLAKPWD